MDLQSFPSLGALPSANSAAALNAVSYKLPEPNKKAGNLECRLWLEKKKKQKGQQQVR